MRRLLFFAIVAAGYVQASTSDYSPKQMAYLYFDEIWNKGRVDLLDSICTSDYINHTPSVPTVPGPEGLKPIVLAIRKAFPDLHFKIEDVIVADGYLTIRTTMTGTQKDSLFGIPPTNKKIQVNQINIEKLRDGKIAEHWRVTDELTMMRQLRLKL